jgi:hypothetical protein
MNSGNDTTDFDNDDDQRLVEDEASRQAAERLRPQLELVPELEPGTADARRTPFAVDPENLKHLAQVTNLYPKPDFEKDVVAVEVAGNRLVATAHRGSITCRAAAPLKPSLPGEQYCRLSFGFPRWQLQAIGSFFSGALNCTLDSDHAEWTIGYGNTLLKLATQDTPNYTYAALEPQQRAASRRFDSDMLRECLACLRLVARKNKTHARMGILEIENGQGRGGSADHVVVFEGPTLRNVRLRIPVRRLRSFARSCSA